MNRYYTSQNVHLLFKVAIFIGDPMSNICVIVKYLISLKIVRIIEKISKNIQVKFHERTENANQLINIAGKIIQIFASDIP